MKIVKLTADSFMKLTAVEVTPTSSIVTISGKNKAGKTSVLKAIEAALRGKDHSPDEPIHKGDKSARVVVETDTITVTRRWTSKGSTLEVKAKDGAVFSSPQSMLDKLVGPLSFDPVAFCRLDPKEQASTLRRLVGLDFTAEDAKRSDAFAKRTEVNREAKRIRGALEKLPASPAGTPDAEVSVAELTEEIERRQAVNATNTREREKLDAMRSKAAGMLEEIEQLENRVATMKAALEALKVDGKTQVAKVDKLTDENLDEVRAKISTAEQTNRAVRSKADRTKLEAEFDIQIAESERLTKYIDQIDELKREATAKASYPIAGLSVDDDGVRFNGFPLEQASGAEQISIGAAIGLALNPKLKVLLVRDASLIDKASMTALASVVEKAGAQVWLEIVSENGAGMTVLIEDGAVKDTETKSEAD